MILSQKELSLHPDRERACCTAVRCVQKVFLSVESGCTVPVPVPDNSNWTRGSNPGTLFPPAQQTTTRLSQQSVNASKSHPEMPVRAAH